MKITFMGTPKFAVPALKIINENFRIDTVYTQPPKKSKRGMKEVISPVHEISNELNLDVRTPKDLSNDLEFFTGTSTLNLLVTILHGSFARSATSPLRVGFSPNFPSSYNAASNKSSG